jgi:hypothetical protein
MRERIAQRAAELRRQAEETKRNAEMQITALLTAAAELEKLLEAPEPPQEPQGY